MNTDEMAVYIGERLLPCPFCGQVAYVYSIESHEHNYCEMPSYNGGWFVECTVCTVAMSAETEQQAITAWNKRKALKAEEDK